MQTLYQAKRSLFWQEISIFFFKKRFKEPNTLLSIIKTLVLVLTKLVPINSSWNGLRFDFRFQDDQTNRWTAKVTANFRAAPAPSFDTPTSFRSFSAQELTRSSWSHKTFDRAHPALSIDVFTLNTHLTNQWNNDKMQVFLEFHGFFN